MNVDKNSRKRSQTGITFNEIFDCHGAFFDNYICDQRAKAMCDFGAKLFCLNPCLYDRIKLNQKLEFKHCQRKLRAANAFPIQEKGLVGESVKTVPKAKEYDFCVVEKSEAENLLGLEIPGSKKSDSLFSALN